MDLHEPYEFRAIFRRRNRVKIYEMKLVVVILLVLCPCTVIGHASMVKPINWMDFPIFIELDNGTWVHDFAGMKSRKHCNPGNYQLACL